MGNYVSCSLSVAIVESQSHGTKVILPNGVIRHLGATSATAAELMLDHPGFFVVHSGSMFVSRRLQPLPADEKLAPGSVYAMFPMDRVGSLARADDLGRFMVGTGKESMARPTTTLEPRRKIGDGLFDEYRYMKSLSRSRRPVMDTITE